MLSDAIESITKTSKALEVLKKIGALADIEKVKDSKNIRCGKGECLVWSVVGDWLSCAQAEVGCTLMF